MSRIIDVDELKKLCSMDVEWKYGDGKSMCNKDTIDVEGVISTMVAGAAILAEYIMDGSTKEDQKYFHGADDSWFDYMPNGLEVVAKVIQVWNEMIEDESGAEIPKLFEGEEFWLQDCVPDKSYVIIKKFLELAGNKFDDDEDEGR